MDLSPEDALRLNVLLANKPLAVRIDEGKMLVQGLMAQGETTVKLSPNARPEQYIRRVRELISGHVLGSPGGYPVYLKRWTRMGQMRDESLEQLLLLGEPEAVVAAVCAPGLTDELARRAWWAMEDAANARHMLGNDGIRQGPMGKVLAEYLLEYLPFETESEDIMETVRLILQPGLLDERQRLDLWRRSTRKQAYLVGFLQAMPDALPDPAPPREPSAVLEAQASSGNSMAGLLLRLYGAGGQTYLKTVAAVLGKPPSQDVVMASFDTLRGHFSVFRPEGDPNLDIRGLVADAQCFVEAPAADERLASLLRAEPALREELSAMRLLSGAGYGLIRPLLPDPTTQGTLMRRKLAPAVDPLLGALAVLRGGRR